MVKRFRLLPYRQGSKGAKALANALGGKVLKLEGSKFKPRTSDILINWGNAIDPANFGLLLKNPSSVIRAASNKREFFQAMSQGGHNEIIPRFWTNQVDIPADAYPVVCRTVLAGHSGEGIVIAATPADLVPAPLYVQYMKKKDEYRVHVGKLPNGTITVIAVQRKARRTDVPDGEVNWQVRNHSNGFVFVRQGVNPPQDVTAAAINALACVGLDFGAVDVIWNDQAKRAYVLEINTAPGLEGQTVTDYATFFRRFGNVASPYAIDVV